MLNRRVLRIKVLQILYASYKKDDNSLKKPENELILSIEKSYELFWLLIMLLDDVTIHAQKISDIRKQKKFATDLEKNPNLRFIENRITKQISTHEEYLKKVNELKISWSQYPELISKIYQTLEKTEVYDIYMNKKDDSFRNDKRIIQFFYSDLLYNSEDLFQSLEEMSIFWIHDIDYILTKITHIIDNIKKEKAESLKFPNIFKKEDDKEFVVNLLHNTLMHTNEYTEIIHKNIVNWDVDRIADTDRIVLLTAISEIVKFPSIPVNVTFNEYIEIAKMFGSDKSGSFINGILDKIIKYMEQNKLFKKSGRGLINS
jgi:N utilization substance protein B